MTISEQAIELIGQAKSIVALSGAGISTEAGIPDFRGQEGLWANPQLLQLMSASGFRRDPAAFYAASLKLLPNITKAEPTGAHRLLAKLETAGTLKAIVTQNIDGLHQAAGSRIVYEIHGTMRTGHCIKCAAKFELKPLFDEAERTGQLPPLCLHCQAPIKPDVVLFDDLLPMDIWSSARQAVESCDLLLVFGSSLIVYPAAELPQIALNHSAKLVIVNLEWTDYDRFAVVVSSKLGDFARAALAELNLP